MAGRSRSPRLPGVRGLIEGVLFLSLLGVSVEPMRDPDFFWHVRVGDWIAAHARVPDHELFSWTAAGRPWVAHEWLSELAMSLLLRHVGLGAVVLGFGLAVLAGLALIYRTAPEAPYPIRAAALVLGVAAANPILGPRTQMLTFTLSAALLLLLRRYRTSGSRRWLHPVPPLFALWANVHAGFAIGLAFVVAHIAGELLSRLGGDAGAGRRLRALGLTLLASLAACVLNPNLLAVYSYPFQTVSQVALMRLVDEWRSPDFHLAQYRALEAMILLTLALLALHPRLRRAAPRHRLHPTDAILLLATLDLSLHAVRHIVLFVAAGTPVLATLLATAWEAARPRLPRLREPAANPVTGALNLAVLLLVGALTALTVAPRLAQRIDGPTIRAAFPVAAVDRLLADPPPGRGFNAFGWGGYLIYRAPDRPVYVYGEAEVLGDALLDEYGGVVTLAPDFRQVLDRRGVEWVIFPSGTPLAVALAGGGDWADLRDDGQAVILVRRDTATQAYRLAHGLP